MDSKHAPCRTLLKDQNDDNHLYNHNMYSITMSSDPSLEAQFIIETFTFRTCFYTDDDDDDNEQEEEEEQQEQVPGAKQQYQYPKEIKVDIKAATTTRGRSLIIPGICDSTGIMIWPASYLLCQYLCYSQSYNNNNTTHPSKKNNVQQQLLLLPTLGSSILELGCGCGIVSLTAALTLQQFHTNSSSSTIRLYCTDVDPDAIHLCSENIQRYYNTTRFLQHNSSSTTSSTSSISLEKNTNTNTTTTTTIDIQAHLLSWGNKQDMMRILKKEKEITSSSSSSSSSSIKNTLDTILAADIIYPTTTDETLVQLFNTVDTMLKPYKEGGIFLLSFVSRDGWKTIHRLIQAANYANYKINSIPYHQFISSSWNKKKKKKEDNNSTTNNNTSTSFLPPLLDAILLILIKEEDDDETNKAAVQDWNNSLGSDTCLVFPGFKRIMMMESSSSSSTCEYYKQEEWIAPNCFDD